MARKPPSLEELRKMVPVLERLSLLYADEKTAQRFTDTVMAAQLMKEVDVSGVEPMYSLLENRSLTAREDKVEKIDKRDVLEPSAKTIEGYFVTPPGNVPFDADKRGKT